MNPTGLEIWWMINTRCEFYLWIETSIFNIIVDTKKRKSQKIISPNCLISTHCFPGRRLNLLDSWEHVAVFSDEVLALITGAEARSASQSLVPLLEEAVDVEENHLVLGGLGCFEELPGRGRVSCPISAHWQGESLIQWFICEKKPHHSWGLK